MYADKKAARFLLPLKKMFYSMPNIFFCSSHIKGIACLPYPAIALATADEAGDIFTKHSKHQEAKYLSRSWMRRTS